MQKIKKKKAWKQIVLPPKLKISIALNVATNTREKETYQV